MDTIVVVVEDDTLESVNTDIQNVVTSEQVHTVSEISISDTTVVLEDTLVFQEDSQESVLVDSESTVVINSGDILPVMEAKMYAEKTDFYTDSIIYKGEAAPGSSPSAASWRIRKIVLSDDGDTDITWAEGASTFTNVWDNRLTLIYS